MRVGAIPIAFWNSWPLIPTNFEDIDFTAFHWKPWSNPSSGECLHCYTEDWRIENIWRLPENSLRYSLQAPYVIGPDYSIFDGPIEVISWQLYRSLQVVGYWQANGVNAIPSVSWSNLDQIIELSPIYRKIFENQSVIAVRAPGKQYQKTWEKAASWINRNYQGTVLHFGTRRSLSLWNKAINLRLRSRKNGNLAN